MKKKTIFLFFFVLIFNVYTQESINNTSNSYQNLTSKDLFFSPENCIYEILISYLGKHISVVFEDYPDAKIVDVNTITLIPKEWTTEFPAGFQWTFKDNVIISVAYRLVYKTIFQDQIDKALALYGEPIFENEVMREWKLDNLELFYNGGKDCNLTIFWASIREYN